jgi:hypothetical protein
MRHLAWTLILLVSACAHQKAASQAPAHPQLTAQSAADLKTIDGQLAALASRPSSNTVEGTGEAASGEGCVAYSEAIAPFIADFQNAYNQFQANAESQGADAYEAFGQFLKNSVTTLKKIKAEGVTVGPHTALTKAVGKLGDDFLALAAATRAGSDAKMTKAEKSLEQSTKLVEAAFDQIKSACG